MDVQSTNDSKLDDVLDFNEFLLKLANAGVPIGLDALDGTEKLSEKLTAINSRVAMAVARGNTVSQFLDADRTLPAQYRSSLALWLYCDRSPNALNALNECANERNKIEKLVGLAFLQPLILLGLIALGVVFLLLGLSPKLEATYSQIKLKPGYGLQLLMLARQQIGIWGLVIPILIAFGLLVWSRNRTHWNFSWFPGRKRVLEMMRKSDYAEGFANLLEHDLSIKHAQTVMGEFKCERNPQRPRPLLQWAMCDEVNNEDKANALHFAARVYRDLAKSRTSQLAAWFPVVVGALIGGLFVLGYALCLFAPMIELLTALASR